MKQLITVFVFIGISLNLFSQGLDEKTKAGFVEQTLKDYFLSPIKSEEPIEYYFKIDTSQTAFNIKIANVKTHFVSGYEANELIRSKKISMLYWTMVSEISKDTVDVLVGGWAVNFKRQFLKKGMFYYSALCGGTEGYIPEGRFVFNYETKRWNYSSQADMIKEAMADTKGKPKE